MADKDLKSMNRTELIEIIYTLRQSAIELEKQNDELKEKLNDRIIRIQKAGSLADASVSLNNVFAKAQIAADEYLKSLEFADSQAEAWARSKREEANRTADEIVAKARQEAEALTSRTKETARECLTAAVKRAHQLESEAEQEMTATKSECEALRAKTEKDIAEQWESFQAKIGEITAKYADLKKVIESAEQLNLLLAGKE